MTFGFVFLSMEYLVLNFASLCFCQMCYIMLLSISQVVFCFVTRNCYIQGGGN